MCVHSLARQRTSYKWSTLQSVGACLVLDIKITLGEQDASKGKLNHCCKTIHLSTLTSTG